MDGIVVQMIQFDDLNLLLVQSLAGVKNGVPFALLFTRVASDAQLLLLETLWTIL